MPRDLTDLLHAWTADHSPHMRAAVDLLIDHKVWLQDPDFFTSFVSATRRDAVIDFAAIDRTLTKGDRRFVLGNKHADTGVLRFATDLALDRWHSSRMGTHSHQALRHAMTSATHRAP